MACEPSGRLAVRHFVTADSSFEEVVSQAKANGATEKRSDVLAFADLEFCLESDPSQLDWAREDVLLLPLADIAPDLLHPLTGTDASPKLLTPQLEELLGLVGDADSVELKLTLPETAHFETAKAQLQAGNHAAGGQSLNSAVAFQKKSSKRLYQIALVDKMFTSGGVTETATVTVERTLRFIVVRLPGSDEANRVPSGPTAT